METEEVYICTVCKQPKLRDEFHLEKRAKSGLRASCKLCRKEYARKYNEANCEARREGRREYARKYNEANPEKAREANREYREANPEKERERSRKRRALKRGAEHEPYTEAELNEMWYEQDGVCFYCYTPLFGHYHVEHMTPLCRGGADKLDNLCLACPTCNLRKNSKTAEEFIALLTTEAK